MAQKWTDDAATKIRNSVNDDLGVAVPEYVRRKWVHAIDEAHAECEAMKQLKRLYYAAGDVAGFDLTQEMHNTRIILESQEESDVQPAKN